MRVKDAVGRFGEQVAADHLTAGGITVLDRNWRCRAGELDLVGREGSTLVMVEVKTRSSLAYGSPAEAVDRRKAVRIRHIAALWMANYRESGEQPFWRDIRFDVVSVLRRRSGGLAVDHLRAAF